MIYTPGISIIRRSLSLPFVNCRSLDSYHGWPKEYMCPLFYIFHFLYLFLPLEHPLLSILIPNTLLASPELAPTDCGAYRRRRARQAPPKLIWLHQSTRQRVKTSSKLFSYLFSLILYVSCVLPLPLSILQELI
jgi:hypothetical protein